MSKQSQAMTSAPALARNHSKFSKTTPPREPVPLPPTINMLSSSDRADLVRKHKKLAQLLGDSVASVHPFAAADPVGTDGWPPLSNRDTLYMSAQGRRHSSPLSPASHVDFLRSLDSASVASMATATTARSATGGRSASPTSFVDMDDDDSSKRSIGKDDDTPATPKARVRHVDSMASVDSFSSTSTSSTSAVPRRRTHRARSISIDVVASPPGSPHGWVVVSQNATGKPTTVPKQQQQPQDSEEERRRKRTKLVKLHRFLGSRVPTDLVLGIPQPIEDDLPPVAQSQSPEDDQSSPSRVKGWIRRGKRGSGSGSGTASPTLEYEDPLNASELDDRERMINVKRAQKMEKLFGAQPPLGLFHTRTRPYGSTGTVRTAPPVEPGRGHAGSAPSTPQMGARALPPLAGSSHRPRPWSRNSIRPSTSESSQGLLRASMEDQEAQFAYYAAEEAGTSGHASSGSPEFRHYQQSLSSLGAMIDRGDRESLMELFDYVNEGSSDEEAQRAATGGSPSTPSERRRSLPPAARSSAASVLSVMPAPDPRGFGARRRRAAKLAQFFGVSYRDLFGEVLDSIEMGVRDEATKGSMQPDEVQELITRLNALKSRGADMDSKFKN
ncbi:hypothetical protein EXIGLDRAFT_673965 [Exidia glandulosa HHB12029]|uniref:Uncharacterized protein n=1 Tax=Exidia glandulosa HHB12029 TaxID=1314781 RepID=A0A165IJU0_EXIGL|nr:hypothetical protein EXIGLDRAFT_673965 [Exidia glandulosa HHB12029]